MDHKKICQICGDPARTKEVYFSHYGALCCLGCKAFFRRIFREGKRNPESLKCKNEGQCDLQSSKQRKCRKCRFDKCIKVGMSPKLVPDEEESKKYTYRKKTKVQSTPAPVILEAFLKAYTESLIEMHLTTDPWIANKIVQGHIVTPWTKEATLAVISWLRNISGMFIRFSYRSAYFMSLSSNDQFLLQQNNTRLFHNYILGRYLGADRGSDQLSWLALPSSQILASDVHLHSVRFEDWNQEGLLLPLNCTELCKEVQTLIQSLSKKFPYSQFHNALIAHCLLFHTSHWSHDEIGQLTEPARIASIEELSEKVLEQSLKDVDDTIATLNVSGLVALLQQMTIIKTSQLSHQHIENMSRQEMQSDEHGWIAQKSNLFEQAKFHIPVSDEFAHTYLLFVSGNIHLRSTSFKMGSYFVSKRMIYMCEAAGLKLSQSDLVQILDKNMAVFYLILIIKNLALKTSYEQVEFYFGDGVALRKYKNEIMKAPQVSMETLHGIDPYYKKHEWGLQRQLSKKINDFLRSQEVFGLVLVIVMLDNMSNQDLKMFQEFTTKMLLKKLKSINSDVPPQEMLKDFWDALSDYSKLLKKLLAEVS